ncbi:MAG TPA: 16S rRNA (adenine(1518)-N(6)/adenine(1519)-N(6))-dimethyltransferase RsmA [Candidatus Limnocylindrales bacterium]
MRSSGTTDGGADSGLPAAVVEPADIRRALRAAGLRARHSLSQNFLADAEVLDAILAEASPRAGDRIVEVGPGLGVLTGALVAAGAAVTAVELDAPLAARLRAEQAAAVGVGEGEPDAPGALRVVVGDALDVDVAAIVRPPFAVVANLPYHITSPILHRLLGAPPRPTRLVLMVQREVAERIAAPPGGMSYLSVFVQFHARPRVARIVPSSAFEPPPAVDSALLVLDVRPDGERRLPAGTTEDDLWRLVQAGFRERRKMLHNVLARQLPDAAASVDRALASARIAPDRRPQTLSVEEWIALLAALRGSDRPAVAER